MHADAHEILSVASRPQDGHSSEVPTATAAYERNDAKRSMAVDNTSSLAAKQKRTWPSPDAPNAEPGVIATPVRSSNSSANRVESVTPSTRGKAKNAPCGADSETPGIASSARRTSARRRA